MPTVATLDEGIIVKMVALLGKIPANDRARFARVQLSRSHPAVVQAFDQIPRQQLQRTALFASLTPHTRETRLAAAARLAEWDTLLVCNGEPRYDAKSYFSFHATLPDLFFLILACWLFPGAIIHSFALKGHHAVLLSRLKPRRLVLDFYDTCSGNLSDSEQSNLQEREAIGLCDGITHRDLRIKHLARAGKCRLPAHNIFIHDPLPEAPSKENSSPAKNEELRIVSIGWVGAGDNSILRVARALVAHRIHLHVYLNPFQERNSDDIEPYVQLEAQSQYFHLENSVYGREYWDTLRRYDFGLSIAEPAVFGQKFSGYTEDCVASCGSSRLSDYIVADLAVIISPEFRFQYFWARRFATATIPATRTFLQNPRPALQRAIDQKQQRAAIDRSGITIRGTAKRLGEFYERVAR